MHQIAVRTADHDVTDTIAPGLIGEARILPADANDSDALPIAHFGRSSGNHRRGRGARRRDAGHGYVTNKTSTPDGELPPP